jgi:hypothetical protein
MRSSFEIPKNEKGNESRIILDDAKDIFNMFNEANITLTGEAQDIILEATKSGYITQDKLAKLLQFLHEAQKDDDE